MNSYYTECGVYGCGDPATDYTFHVSAKARCSHHVLQGKDRARELADAVAQLEDALARARAQLVEFDQVRRLQKKRT